MHGQGKTDKALFDHDFDDFVEATLQKWHVPGMSIAVIDNGAVVSKGYGFATLPDRAATADTIYMTGSTTKAFTAAVAALLVHDNQNYPGVKWTSSIHDTIPGFVLENEFATKHTTIEDALVHRAGLPRHDLVHGQPNDSPSSVVEKLRYLPLTSEPRQQFDYCPLMFAPICHWIETIAGQDLKSLLEDRLWKPLRMFSTFFTKPSNDNRLAQGYYWYENEARYISEPYDDLWTIAGSGDIFSNVNDYALWIKALLQPTEDSAISEESSSPLTKDIVRDLFTPRIVTDKRLSDYNPVLYALGWEIMNLFGETIVTHAGGETGFGTQIYMLPKHQYGVVTMANTLYTGNIVGAAIAEDLLSKKLNRSHHVYKDSLVSLFHRDFRLETPTFRNACFEAHPDDGRDNTATHPHPIADFIGSYTHPAYGDINLTQSHETLPDKEVLEAIFYPRTWPLKIQLTRVSSTVFSLRLFKPHGIGDVQSGKNIVWSGEEAKDDRVRAVFEIGSHDGTVRMVGIELEERLVDMARTMGDSEWRRGMIWFQRM